MTKIDILEQYSGNINDLFLQYDLIAFLAGAGVSMNPPSNVPSAPQMVHDLITYAAPEEEVEKLLALENLRYETVVQNIESNIDPSLKFLEYLSLIGAPNFIHYFLAQGVLHNRSLITTNFDFLIEFALQSVCTDQQKMNLFPIITRQDYQKYEEYIENNELASVLPFCKIHGSRRDIINQQETKDSLITTTIALSKDRGEGETFAIESYKRRTIEHFLKDRCLIVMGYSGSDDFDIGPLLKEFTDIKRIIWLEHKSRDVMEIFELQDKEIPPSSINELERSHRLLLEIKQKNQIPIYIIQGDTIEIIKKIWTCIFQFIPMPEIKEPAHEVPKFDSWVYTLFKDVEKWQKYFFAVTLYRDCNKIEEAIQCASNGLHIVEESKNDRGIYEINNVMGLMHKNRGNLDKGLRHYEVALDHISKIGNKFKIAGVKHNMGLLYGAQGNLHRAIQYTQETLDLYDKEAQPFGHMLALNNLGLLHKELNQYDQAMPYFEQALEMIKKHGGLSLKATVLNNMGLVYSNIGQNDKAIGKYEEALKINTQLNDKIGIAKRLGNIGYVWLNKNDYSKAMGFFLRSLQYYQELQDKPGLTNVYNSIGMIYTYQRKFNTAMDYFTKALKISEEIGNKREIRIRLENIGKNCLLMGKLELAETYVNRALDIAVGLEDSKLQADSYSTLGEIYRQRKKLQEAYDSHKKAADIYLNLKMDLNFADELGLLNPILSLMGFYDESNKEMDRAIEIYSNHKKLPQLAKSYVNKGISLVGLSKWDEAFDFMNKASDLYKQIGMDHKIKEIDGFKEIMTQKRNQKR